jgi:hypothetical protein
LPDHDLWPYFKTLNAEIAKFAQMVLFRGKRSGPADCSNPAVHTVAWSTETDTYVMAVNSDDERASFAIRGVAADQVRLMLEGDGRVRVADSTVTDSLPAYGVRVYVY